jgi:hypothetical protein
MEAQLERAERKKATKRIAELESDLAMPPFPTALVYLWEAYIRLRRRKAPGFNGAEPIGWQDIDAFLRRSGIRLASWEIRLLEAIDDIFMSPQAPKPEMPDGQSVTHAASATDVAGVRSVLGSVSKRRGVKRKGGVANGRHSRVKPPGK